MSREKPFIASVTARDDVFPGQQPFAEGGLTGREMAAYNWADHPLGLPQHWDPLLAAHSFDSQKQALIRAYELATVS